MHRDGDGMNPGDGRRAGLLFVECPSDIRMLGQDQAADHFVDGYRQLSRRPLLPRYWEMFAPCNAMPDIAVWLAGWQALGFDIRPGERPQPVAARAPQLSLRKRRRSPSACGGHVIDDPVDLVI